MRRTPQTWWFGACSSLLFMAAPVLLVPNQVFAQAAQLSGTLRTRSGAELPQAKVTLLAEGSAPLPLATTTDQAGHYTFRDVHYGVYSISTELSGYTTNRRDKVSISSPAVVVDLTLARAENAGYFAVESTPSADQAVPTFSASEIEGATAPSGYSSASNDEKMAHVMDHVIGSNSTRAKAEALPATPPDCAKLRDLQRIAEAEPANFEVHRKLGLLYLATGQMTQGIHQLSLAQKLQPSHAQNNLDLATAYFRTGRYPEAIALLQTAFRSDTNNLNNVKLLAASYAGSGNLGAAADTYRTAFHLNADEENTLAYSLALISMRNTSEAAGVLRAGLTKYPQSPRMWFGLALTESLEGRNSASVASLLHALEFDQSYEPAYGLLAELVGTTPDRDEEILRRESSFLALAPNSDLAHYDYALSLWNKQKGRTDQPSTANVLYQLELAIQKNPQLFRAHYQLGIVYAAAHRDNQAIPNFEKAIALAPSFAEAHYRLSQAYRRTGRVPQANHELAEFRRLRSLGARADDDAKTYIQTISTPNPETSAQLYCAAAKP